MESEVKIFCKLFILLGYIFSYWGLVNLGKSFSISPELRKITKSGPYKFMKHPMYFGYFISETAIMVYFLSWRNFLVWVLSMTLYYIRAKKEERVLVNFPLDI